MDNTDNTDNIKNSREITQIEGAIPGGVNISSMRPLSISTIAMCQMLNLGILDSILNNKEIDYSNMNELIKFLWLHCAPEEEVCHYVSNYRLHPEWLEQEALKWGMNVDISALENLMYDTQRDRDNINNAKSQVIPEKGSKPRKNSQSQVC